MAIFLEDLKTYLESKGYENIGKDVLPGTPDQAVGLFVTEHKGSMIADGSATRYIKVQVRAANAEDAYVLASQMATHIDSGPDENIIHLTDTRWGIGRIRSHPCKLSVDESGRTVYYFEFSFWGEDIL